MDRTNAVELVKEARRGSHDCLFYQSQNDLIDLAADYFISGINKGETCIWVTADGSLEKEARKTLGKKLQGPGAGQAQSQIEFISCYDWYLRGGTFNPRQVLGRWIEKVKQASDGGYSGLRVSGDVGWMDATDWKTLMGYESDINGAIVGHSISVLCSYPLPKINASQMIDVIGRHQMAIGKNNGRWQTLKSLDADAADVDATVHAAIAGKLVRGNERGEYPVLFPENCDGCGLCVDVCASGSLYLNNGRIALEPVGECDWCAICEAVCLSNAIFCPFEITVEP